MAMDPLSLVMSALAAGASAALKDTAGQAVTEAYAGLKELLKRKLGDRPLAGEVIEKHEEAPEVWDKPVEKELGESGVAEDEEVLRAAQQVLVAADPEGAQAGKYNVSISGGKGIVVGDRAKVTMTFENGD
jgi:hypothetical protein